MPHLGYTAVCSAIESFGRERRVRIYGSEYYKQVMLASGQTVDPAKMPQNPAAQGHWQGTSHRRFFDSLDVLLRFLDNGQVVKTKPSAVVPKKIGRPRKDTKATSAIASDPVTPQPPPAVRDSIPDETSVAAAPSTLADNLDEDDESIIKTGRKRGMLYDTSTQVRGRPRKYIHVVDLDGTRNKKVIGLIRPRPGLPSLLIYIPSAKKLVEAPPGYSGLGAAPPLTDEEIRAGKPPSFYLNLPDDDEPEGEEKDTTKVSTQPSSKPTKRRKTTKDKEAVRAPEAVSAALKDSQSGRSPALDQDTGKILATVIGDPATNTVSSLAQDASSKIQEAPVSDTPVAVIPTNADSAVARSDLIAPQATESVSQQLEGSASGSGGKRRMSPEPPAVPASPRQQPKTKRARTTEIDKSTSQADRGSTAFVGRTNRAQSSADTASAPTMPNIRPTPIREVKPSSIVPQPKAQSSHAAQAGELCARLPGKHLIHTAPGPRIDLGNLRRNNELVQCLIDSGGVLSDSRLYHEHRTWSEQWVGTDHPHAPLVVTGMDRGLFKRLIGNLLREGRIMESKATIPTTTGRWTKTGILYTPDTSKATRDAYIRALASDGVYTPPKLTKIAAAAYGELKVPKPSRLGPISQQPQIGDDIDRRSLLLSEPSVVAFLYGYQQNRNTRLKSYHQAILRAMSHAQTTAIVSTSPRIFSTSLLFEDFEVGDFFANIYTTSYNEELEVYLRNPENRKTRIADLSPHLAPRRGFAGHGAKLKMGTLMTALCTLKIASALSPTSNDQAPIRFTGSDGIIGYFDIQEAPGLASYYILHDWVPLYHLAIDPCAYIRAYPALDERQVEEFWSLVQSAALEVDTSVLPAKDDNATMSPPQMAFCPANLQLPIDQLKMIRSPHRWTARPRLLPSQQAALRGAVNDNGTLTVQAPEDIEQLAWENALTPSFVQTQLAFLSERARHQFERLRVLRREEYEKSQRRQKAAEESLQRKIAQSRAVGKAEWEARVRDACAAVGAEYSEELQAFVGRNVVSAVRMTSVNDDAIRQQVKIWMRAHQHTWDADTHAAMPPTQHPLPPTIVRPVQARKPRRDKKPKEPKDPEGKSVHRISWQGVED